MLRIAVVDDEPIILKKITEKIKELSDAFEEEYSIEKFTDHRAVSVVIGKFLTPLVMILSSI